MRAILLLFCLPATAFAQVATSSDTELRIQPRLRLGFEWDRTEGSKVKVGELRERSSRPRGDGRITVHKDAFYLDLAADFRHEREHHAELIAESTRRVRAEVTYDSIPHRLVHDPLRNLGFAGAAGLDVTDNDPTRDYDTLRRELKPVLRITLPDAGPVKQIQATAKYRYLLREGHEQARTVAHCGSCHVYADTRRLDQRMNAFEVGLEGRIEDKLSVAYRHNWRSVEERASPPTYAYPEVPPLASKLLPIDGDQVFGSVPDTRRHADRIAILWDGPHTLKGTGLYSRARSRNDVTDYGTTVQIAGLRLTARPLLRMHTTASYRFLRVDPDARDAIRRRGHRANLDLFYTIPSIVRIEGGYAFERLTRDNVLIGRSALEDVSDGEYFVDLRDTQIMTKNQVTVALVGSWLSRLRGKLRYRLVLVENPLGTIGRQGSFSPETGDQPSSNVDGLYPDRSPFPSSAHELRAELRCRVGYGLSVVPTYALKLGKGDRKITDHFASLVASWTPLPTLQLNGAYNLRQNRIRTDLYYGQIGGLRSLGEGFVDVASDTEYDSLTHTGLVQVAWSPFWDLWLRANGAWTRSDALFESTGVTAGIGNLSELGIDIKSASVSVDYRLSKRWSVGALYRIDQYLDYPSRRYDGRAHRAFVSLAWHP